MSIKTIIRKRVVRKAKPVADYSIAQVRKKQKLRDLGYVYTMTLYGVVYQKGLMRRKRIEVCSKFPIKQVHNAFLYEVMVRQDMSNPAVQQYHAKYAILNQAKHKGAPKEDYLVLTWNELKAGNYDALGGEWMEYDQET